MCDNGKMIDLMRYSSNCKMNYQIRLDFFLHLDKKESFHLSRIKSKELGYIIIITYHSCNTANENLFVNSVV